MHKKKMDLSSCVLFEEDKKKVQDAICVLSNFSGAGSSSGASESASRTSQASQASASEESVEGASCSYSRSGLDVFVCMMCVCV